jgi:hypothetical protein
MADGAQAESAEGRSFLSTLLVVGGATAALLGLSGLLRSFVAGDRPLNWASGLVFFGALLITGWGLRSPRTAREQTMAPSGDSDLGDRRKRWFTLGAMIVAGWGLAAVLLAAPGLIGGSWVRLGTFLSLTMAPGLLGREWLIKKNGSVDFPRAPKS